MDWIRKCASNRETFFCTYLAVDFKNLNVRCEYARDGLEFRAITNMPARLPKLVKRSLLALNCRSVRAVTIRKVHHSCLGLF
jgi:hypothetical protein